MRGAADADPACAERRERLDCDEVGADSTFTAFGATACTTAAMCSVVLIPGA